MKSKVLAFMLVIVCCITGIFYQEMEVKAEETKEEVAVDYSYLVPENALVGYANISTRGVYLAEGNSFINKQSSNQIGAGGNTVAALKCKVSVTAIVERKVNGSWVNVTSFTTTTASGFTAVTSRILTVGTGYYYRVRCNHYASTDVSSSSTNALWMGN